MSDQTTCPECGQPILAEGQQRQHPDDYRHASGCPANDAPCESCNGAGFSEPTGSPDRVPEADRKMIFHVCQKLAVVLGLNAQEQAWLESLGATFPKANDLEKL